jgi:hypothetical protein
MYENMSINFSLENMKVRDQLGNTERLRVTDFEALKWINGIKGGKYLVLTIRNN